jgi:serine/threonine protein kinase
MTTTRICPDTVQLQRFVARDLAEDVHTQLEEHIRECRVCEKTLAGLSEWGCSLLPLGEAIPHTRVPQGVDAPSWCPGDTPALLSPAGKTNRGGAPPRSAPDSLKPGERLNKYVIIGVLGRGGMGVVYKAHDSVLDRTVAIKVPGPLLVDNPVARMRFMREGRTAAAVKDQHIVTVYGVEGAEEFPYIVLEFVEGKSLQHLLENVAPLPIDEVVRIGAQIAQGLAAAHQKGLIHRDIKPANILLEEATGRVAITDFGLARAVDDSSLSRSGEICGTPQFMSPKQVNGRPIDHRADLFSLGSVLYYMCAGHLPFTASSSMAVCHRVLTEHPTPLEEHNSNIPAWLVALIKTLHAKDPAERIQSAAEVRDALLAGERGQATRRDLPAPQRLVVDDRSPAPRSPGAMVAVLVVAVFLLSFGGFFLLNQAGTKSGHEQPPHSRVAAAEVGPASRAGGEDEASSGKTASPVPLGSRQVPPIADPPVPTQPKTKDAAPVVSPQTVAIQPEVPSGSSKHRNDPPVVEGVVVVVAGDQASQTFLKDEGLCVRELNGSRVVILKQGRNYIPLGDYRVESDASSPVKVSPKRFTVSSDRSAYINLSRQPASDPPGRPPIILPPPPEGFPPSPPPPPFGRRPPGP